MAITWNQATRLSHRQRRLLPEPEQDRLIQECLAPSRAQAELWTAEMAIRLLLVAAAIKLLLGL